jgi:hypothetical protein
MHVYSQQELMRQNIHEVSHRHKYTEPSSVPDSNFKKTQERDCPLSVRIHPQARNLSSLHMELVIILPIFCCFSSFTFIVTFDYKCYLDLSSLFKHEFIGEALIVY